MCLSSNMVDFQKERMQYIVKKEAEIKQKEKDLVSLTECNNSMEKYKSVINKISLDLTKTIEDFNLIVKYANQNTSSPNITIHTEKEEPVNHVETIETFGNFEQTDLLDTVILDE